MRILWLTSDVQNVCEDYLLVGLTQTEHQIVVQPHKATCDYTADLTRHVGHICTTGLRGKLVQQAPEGIKPEAIIVARAWRDRPYVERVLDNNPGVPVFFFDGEDQALLPPDWLAPRCRLTFVSQCPPALVTDSIRPLPPCARGDLFPRKVAPWDEKIHGLVWGGKLGAGHGDRYTVLGPLIAEGLLDDVACGMPFGVWSRLLGHSRFSISLGCCQNSSPGANVSLFEAGLCGAGVLVFDPNIVITPLLPPNYAWPFRSVEEFIALAHAVRCDALPKLPSDLAAQMRAQHSHTARAAQMVEQMTEVM